MNLYTTLYLIFLFVVLSPGVFLRIPPKGSKLTVAVVHGLVFAFVYYLTCNFFLNSNIEDFRDSIKNRILPVPKPRTKEELIFSTRERVNSIRNKVANSRGKAKGDAEKSLRVAEAELKRLENSV